MTSVNGGDGRLASAFDSPPAKRAYVRRLFSTIATRYDFITVLLSYGQDRRWKRQLVSLADPRPGTEALDLACGTGDIAFGLAGRGARVIGLDITHRMLQLASGKQRTRPAKAALVAGDMMALPFPDNRFDVVTTGYGIRNVPDIATAIAEMRRVLRPGGLLLSLDFDRPSNPVVRAGYLAYLTIVGATLGWVLHRDPDTYRYIPESIRRYPGAARVSAVMLEQGFTSTDHIPVLGGLMAIHRATK